jgi:hypothetical protein
VVIVTKQIRNVGALKSWNNQLIAKKLNSTFVAELKPSKKIQQLVIVIHVIALAACFANALPLEMKLVTALLIGLNLTKTHPALKKERRIITYTEKQGWQISNGGDFKAVTILKSTVTTTFFIFLHLQNESTTLIAYDALDETDYRDLIVRLKITAD